MFTFYVIEYMHINLSIWILKSNFYYEVSQCHGQVKFGWSHLYFQVYLIQFQITWILKLKGLVSSNWGCFVLLFLSISNFKISWFSFCSMLENYPKKYYSKFSYYADFIMIEINDQIINLKHQNKNWSIKFIYCFAKSQVLPRFKLLATLWLLRLPMHYFDY